MDRCTDLEMPSPKRIRLEAPGSEAAIDPATPVDDIDNLYGASPVQPHSPTGSCHAFAPGLDTPSVPIDQKPFQLPGLGMLDEDPTSSTQIPQQQSQVPFIPVGEKSSSTENVKDTELEDGQKLQVNGGQDATVENERIVDFQITGSERSSFVPGEIPMPCDDTAIAEFEEQVSEVEAPISQEVTGSGSMLAPKILEWHSSGTIIDNGFWLGDCCIEEAPSTALESQIALDWHSSGTVMDSGFWLGGYSIKKALAMASKIPTTLDWHSSGTVIDNGIWLGGYSIDKIPVAGPDSNTAKVGGTSAVVWQDKDVNHVDDDFREQSLSGAKLVDGRSEQTASEKPALEDSADADKDIEEAEFEYDSSPLDSDSSSDDSTDTSSSDDSDADDYEMLSPAEQARRLMAEDGGSDGDGKGKGRKAIAEAPRTLNEKPDEYVPKSTVRVTEDMKIEELGLVENMVENMALIKANTSGEYQVLESGSLLCLQDRSVIGHVSETLGRVQQPYYCVRFTDATAIVEAGIEKGTKIFYVAQHSTTVFTQPLRAFKGSDASNLHDEEVDDDELEFSDDEAEAEHKRQIKQQRVAKRNNRDGQPDGYSRGPQQQPGEPGPRRNGGLHPVQEHPPNSAEATLNYDDTDRMDLDTNENEDDLYTPLTRPANLHEILSGKAPSLNNHGGYRNANRGRGDSRGGHRGSNRGRGSNRSRGGDRGMRDSERGGSQNWRNRGGRGQAHGHPVPPTPHTNSFSPSQSHGLSPRPNSEAINNPRSTHQGTALPYPTPLQSPVPSPAYQTYQQQSQSHGHPGYPPPYPNAYNQSHFQQNPPHAYSSTTHQQNYSQYQAPQQPHPHQGYTQQFASQPDISYAPRQPQYPPSIPPGAHINPNLFRQQGQSSSPQAWQQGYNQQPQQQYLASPGSSSTGPPAPVPNEPRLQDLLSGFGRGGG